MAFNFPTSWGPFPGAQFPYTQTGALNMDWVIWVVKNLIAEWKQTAQDWETQQEAFNSLKTYVDQKFTEIMNWFDNLDVQEEINNKLDEMLDSGELEQAISLLDSFVNAYSLGFRGNGTTEDTQTLQTIITQNRYVIIPAGNYTITQGVIVPSNSVIYGYGATVTTTGLNVFIADNSENVTIEGFNLANTYTLYNMASYDDATGFWTINEKLHGNDLKVGDTFTSSMPNFSGKPNLPVFTITSVQDRGFVTKHPDYGTFNGIFTENYPFYAGTFDWDVELISAESAINTTIRNVNFSSGGYAVHAPDSSGLSMIGCNCKTCLDDVLIGDTRNNRYNFLFSGCTFTNYDYGKQGIVAYNFSDNPSNGMLYNVVVENCVFIDISEAGVSFSYFGNRMANVQINNCFFSDCFLHAATGVGEGFSVRQCTFRSTKQSYRTDCYFGYPLGFNDPVTTHNTVEISDCTFENTYGVSNGNNANGVPNYMTVRNCTFNNEGSNRLNCNILGPTIADTCVFNDGEPNTSLHSRYAFYIAGEFDMRNCTVEQIFYPDTGSACAITCTNCKFAETSMAFSASPNMHATFERCAFDGFGNFATTTNVIILDCTVDGAVLGDVYQTSGLSYNGSAWVYGSTPLTPLKITPLITVPTPSQYENSPSPVTINNNGLHYNNKTLDFGSVLSLYWMTEHISHPYETLFYNDGFAYIMLIGTANATIPPATSLFSLPFDPYTTSQSFWGIVNGVPTRFSTAASSTIVQNTDRIESGASIYISVILPVNI